MLVGIQVGQKGPGPDLLCPGSPSWHQERFLLCGATHPVKAGYATIDAFTVRVQTPLQAALCLERAHASDYVAQAPPPRPPSMPWATTLRTSCVSPSRPTPTRLSEKQRRNRNAPSTARTHNGSGGNGRATWRMRSSNLRAWGAWRKPVSPSASGAEDGPASSFARSGRPCPS